MTTIITIGNYKFPTDRFFWMGDPGHTWAAPVDSSDTNKDVFRVGIDDFGQKHAQRIILVRIKPEGTEIPQGSSVATLESAKWVGPVRSPFGGIIRKANPAVLDDPSLVNSDPYGEGWLCEIEANNVKKDIKSHDIIQKGDEDATRLFIEAEIEKFDT